MSAINDNFDAYNDGDLNGQGGWVGDVQYDVQGTIVQAGAKAVKIANQGSVYRHIYKDFTNQSDGNQICYMRAESVGSNIYPLMFMIKEGTTLIGRIQFSETPAIHLIGATTVELVSGYNTSQWYNFEMEWRSSDGKIRGRVDNGTWSAWIDPSNAWTNIDRVHFQGGKNSDAYCDSLSYTPPPVAGRSFGYIMG